MQQFPGQVVTKLVKAWRSRFQCEKQQLESFADSTIKAIAAADRSIKVEYKILQVEDRYPGVEFTASRVDDRSVRTTKHTVLSGVILKSIIKSDDLVQRAAEKIVEKLG